jgi:leader peptidase (prepilin peptidase)/N-methyltransferase
METLFHLVTFAFVFALGASVGSFLNVVIYRLPQGISLVYPPSHCPKCHHRLGKSENIPVFGWLWLGVAVAGVERRFLSVIQRSKLLLVYYFVWF